MIGISMKRYLEKFHPLLYGVTLELRQSGFPNLDTMAPNAVAVLIAQHTHYPVQNFDSNPMNTLVNMEEHVERLKEAS